MYVNILVKPETEIRLSSSIAIDPSVIELDPNLVNMFHLDVESVQVFDFDAESAQGFQEKSFNNTETIVSFGLTRHTELDQL